jgi:glutamate/tyrosine decarboxylase-like PLP-dependent enzyme
METEDADAASPWAWSRDDVKRVGYQVVDLIADYLTELPERPVFQPVPPALINTLLTTPLPEQGTDMPAILTDFAAQIAPYPFGNGHPRFWGWVNSPPAPPAIFAEALAAAMNPSCAGGNHAAVYVEREVIGWFRDLIGFPPETMGLLVSGGSMATLTALAIARQRVLGQAVRAEGVPGGDSRLTVYMSGEGHGCVRKAVELLGIGSAQIRTIPVDERYRMRVADLDAAIRADQAAGHRPMAVVATAGTVNTGAIDPLAEIASVCRAHGVWLHVDGAYGTPALLTERYHPALAPLALADSLALDPHKWLYIPVEAGLVLVRDGAAMRDTFSLVPPYLRTDGSLTGTGGLPWFSEYGFQQTRGFRALKVWMALRYYGRAGYQAAIDGDLDLAAYLAARVQAAPDLDLAAPPGLSIVCFRYRPATPALDGDQLNEVNKALLADIQLGGQAFLSSTVLEDRFVLRACIVNPRSRQADIDLLVDLVQTTGARLVSER